MRKRMFWLDAVKVVALFCVLTIHFNAEVSRMFTLDLKIGANHILNGIYLGDFGVVLYFISSGAALQAVWGNRDSYSLKTFYWKRIKAIYPMFWLAWVIFTGVLLFVYKFISPAPAWTLLLTLLGQDGYVTALGLVTNNFYVLGEWFLGCILLMYAVAPLLMYGCKKQPLATLAVTIVIAWLCGFSFMPGFFRSTIWFLRRLPEFVFGMVVIRCVPKMDWKVSAVGAAAMILGLAGRRFLPGLAYPVWMGSGAFLLIGGAADYLAAPKLQAGIANFCKYFYAFFLTHHVIIRIMVYYLIPESMRRRELLVLYAAYLAVTYLVSVKLFDWNDKMVKGITALFSRTEPVKN